MAKHVRVGVVSTSWWADMMHLPALKSHPQAEVIAICGRHRDRAEEMAQKYAIPHVFTDYHELITKSGIDALIVAPPADLHYPMTMAALDAGLHVICEKPVALRAHQAQEMYDKATAAGVKHMTYFTWRWLPYFQYLHQLIQEGYLGRVYHGHFRYFGGFRRRQDQDGWGLDPQRSLGVLGALGSHMIDLARWCLGDVAKVNAHLGTFVTHSGPDGTPRDVTNDSALVTLEFQNGSHAVIHSSGVAHIGDRMREQYVRLDGEAGTVEVEANIPEGYVIRGARSDEGELTPLPIPQTVLQGIDPHSPFFDQYTQIFTQQSVGCRLFIDAIVHDHAVVPSLYDGLKAQEIMEAAIHANQQARWIDVQ